MATDDVETDRREAEKPDVVAQPKRRWWPWALLACLVAVGAYLFFVRGQAGATPGATGTAGSGAATPTGDGAPARGGAPGGGRGVGRPVPVVAQPARTGELPVYLNGLGTATGFETVTVRTRVDGQLDSVNFREGQLVHQGDLLARIDPRPFEVQLTQAQGQMAKDEAALKNAQLDLERYRALFAQDAIPRQQLDTQAATVNQFEGAIKTDEGQVAAARLNLTYSEIRAPLTGRIGLRQVDPGNMVHAADQNGLAVITEVHPIAVLFTLPEDALGQVLSRTRGGRQLTVEAWDRDLTSRLSTGTLLTTDNEIDPATGTVRLKAVFQNRDDMLFPNQFVNARLLLDTLRGVVIVPAAAVQQSPQGTFVWVIGPDNRAQMRACQVRLTEGDESAVTGVSAGEKVVVDGVDRLQQGAPVIVQAEAGQGGAPAAQGRGGRTIEGQEAVNPAGTGTSPGTTNAPGAASSGNSSAAGARNGAGGRGRAAGSGGRGGR